jgi:hypothetical protein
MSSVDHDLASQYAEGQTLIPELHTEVQKLIEQYGFGSHEDSSSSSSSDLPYDHEFENQDDFEPHDVAIKDQDSVNDGNAEKDEGQTDSVNDGKAEQDKRSDQVEEGGDALAIDDEDEDEDKDEDKDEDEKQDKDKDEEKDKDQDVEQDKDKEMQQDKDKVERKEKNQDQQKGKDKHLDTDAKINQLITELDACSSGSAPPFDISCLSSSSSPSLIRYHKQHDFKFVEDNPSLSFSFGPNIRMSSSSNLDDEVRKYVESSVSFVTQGLCEFLVLVYHSFVHLSCYRLSQNVFIFFFLFVYQSMYLLDALAYLKELKQKIVSGVAGYPHIIFFDPPWNVLKVRYLISSHSLFLNFP